MARPPQRRHLQGQPVHPYQIVPLRPRLLRNREATKKVKLPSSRLGKQIEKRRTRVASSKSKKFKSHHTSTPVKEESGEEKPTSSGTKGERRRGPRESKRQRKARPVPLPRESAARSLLPDEPSARTDERSERGAGHEKRGDEKIREDGEGIETEDGGKSTIGEAKELKHLPPPEPARPPPGWGPPTGPPLRRFA